MMSAPILVLYYELESVLHSDFLSVPLTSHPGYHIVYCHLAFGFSGL